MNYSCCDQRRRGLLENSKLNGIDFVEVSTEHELEVHFIKDLDLKNHPLGPENVRIEGGGRIRNIIVTSIRKELDGEAKNLIMFQVSQPGDTGNFTLKLVNPSDPQEPPAGYDPAFAEAEFSFNFNARSEFDPRHKPACLDAPLKEPVIEYQAKDYSSFRRLLLDRLATVMPDWQERRIPDVGVALVELLAYVGDYLSYQQDAVATEAYLGTARRRASVRRHARLIDYQMHDGCNARVWVQVQVDRDKVEPKKGVTLYKARTQFLTGMTGEGVQGNVDNPVISFGSAVYEEVLRQGVVVFEPMHNVTLYPQHNEMEFYTWSNRRCCLPRGTTSATLKGDLANLKKGDVLIFEEICDPNTGKPNDSDVRTSHAVRLVEDARAIPNPLGQQHELEAMSLEDEPEMITEISWAEADALPFPLCISSRTDAENGERDINNVSVARGNIVLADHGRTLGSFADPDGQKRSDKPEQLRDGSCEKVPEVKMFRASVPSGDRCQQHEQIPVMPRFRPALRRGPLTNAMPFDKKDVETPAAELMKSEPKTALPAIRLKSNWQAREADWTPKLHLLDSGQDDMEFVVETETEDEIFLRFGDNQHGLRPASGTSFTAVYRVGNGTAGNVGLEAIAYLVTDDANVKSVIADQRSRSGGNAVRNPLPASGGTDMERIDDVRKLAPTEIISKRMRGVTKEDYAALLDKSPYAQQIQKVAVTYRWTGSWHTVFLTIDRNGGLPLDANFKRGIKNFLEPYRMSGYDLEVEEPRYVPLEIEMKVSVKEGRFRSDVKEALLEEFSNRVLDDGRLGFFHPDNLTFQSPIYLSQLCARAQSVLGVASVEITQFRCLDGAGQDAFIPDKIEFGPLEIARLDNNPNFPEYGRLTLKMEGGR